MSKKPHGNCKYNKKYADLLIEWGKRGDLPRSYNELAVKFGVVRQSVSNWFRDHKDFAEAYQVALAEEQVFIDSVLRRSAMEEVDVIIPPSGRRKKPKTERQMFFKQNQFADKYLQHKAGNKYTPKTINENVNLNETHEIKYKINPQEVTPETAENFDAIRKALGVEVPKEPIKPGDEITNKEAEALAKPSPTEIAKVKLVDAEHANQAESLRALAKAKAKKNGA